MQPHRLGAQPQQTPVLEIPTLDCHLLPTQLLSAIAIQEQPELPLAVDGLVLVGHLAHDVGAPAQLETLLGQCVASVLQLPPLPVLRLLALHPHLVQVGVTHLDDVLFL